MRKLKLEQVVLLHEQLILETGGSEGIRDAKLLDSALETPFSSFGGVMPYPTIEAKASRLGYGIIKNHPFVDGNKKIGVLAMLVFIEINGVLIKATDDEIIKIGIDLASGNMTDKELLSWIIVHN